jgi:IS4 transposase
LLVRKEHPPENETPIEWRLLTDETLTTLADAVLRIEWYRRRWLIELFFRTLKTGCNVEELQLSTKERLEKTIVSYMIIAWRVLMLMLMTLGREVPELPCEVIFDREEWQAA